LTVADARLRRVVSRTPAGILSDVFEVALYSV